MPGKRWLRCRRQLCSPVRQHTRDGCTASVALPLSMGPTSTMCRFISRRFEKMDEMQPFVRLGECEMKSARRSLICLTIVLAVVSVIAIPSYAQSNTWSSGASMLTPRFGTAFGVISGKIYVVGGATASAVVDNNEVYNPTTNTWATKTPDPTARFAAAAAVVNGILYVIGGCDSGCATGGGAMTLVEAYNPVTDSWSTKASLPTPTDSVYAVAKSGTIYVVGGYVQGPGRVG